MHGKGQRHLSRFGWLGTLSAVLVGVGISLSGVKDYVGVAAHIRGNLDA
jgi:hypothetical protein